MDLDRMAIKGVLENKIKIKRINSEIKTTQNHVLRESYTESFYFFRNVFDVIS